MDPLRPADAAAVHVTTAGPSDARPCGALPPLERVVPLDEGPTPLGHVAPMGAAPPPMGRVAPMAAAPPPMGRVAPMAAAPPPLGRVAPIPRVSTTLGRRRRRAGHAGAAPPGALARRHGASRLLLQGAGPPKQGAGGALGPGFEFEATLPVPGVHLVLAQLRRGGELVLLPFYVNCSGPAAKGA